MRTWTMGWMAVVGILGLTLGVVAGCVRGPGASTAEEFYRGKTVTWVVSSDSGGSADLLSRTIAPYLAKEIGATVRVDTTGSDQSINDVYTQAKRDGLTLVINATAAVISNDILKAPGVQYETEKFNFVADVYRGNNVFQVSPKLPYRTIEALREAKGLKAGGTTAKGSMAVNAAVMFEILGLDGKVITGFTGKKAMTLALGRGEIDIMVTSDSTALKDEQDGYLVNAFVVTEDKSPALTSVPTMFELGGSVTKELKAVHEYIGAGGTALMLTPDVPAERVEYLRKVFQKLNNDGDLRKDVEKVAEVWRPFAPGEELQRRMVSIKANKDLVGQIDAILNKYRAAQ